MTQINFPAQAPATGPGIDPVALLHRFGPIASAHRVGSRCQMQPV